jgi:NAD(P)-dependent dehydrogenase (short-subunit alcohol dehydrogenase family)
LSFKVAARTVTEDPFQLTLEEYRLEMNANTSSAFVAAKEAVTGFAKTGPGSTFFFTGNVLNLKGKPDVLVFGMGKSAMAALVRSASLAYTDKGYK